MATPRKLRSRVDRLNEICYRVCTAQLAPDVPSPASLRTQFLTQTLDEYEPTGIRSESQVLSTAEAFVERDRLTTSYLMREWSTGLMVYELAPGRAGANYLAATSSLTQPVRRHSWWA